MNTEYESSLIKHQLRPRKVRQYRVLYQKCHNTNRFETQNIWKLENEEQREKNTHSPVTDVTILSAHLEKSTPNKL